MYIEKLTDTQIKEIANSYGRYDNIDIERGSEFLGENYIEVTLAKALETEKYTITDFMITLDFCGDPYINYLRKFRQAMLKIFGNQYAIDCLLDC